ALYGLENPKSSPQCAQALRRIGVHTELTEKGNPSVPEHVLKVITKQAPDSDAGHLATLILDWRHSDTVLNLFLAPYAQLCARAAGRARPPIYPLSAAPGRMPCTRPNAQQLPREGGIRPIYTADPGHMFISADFSGVELRGAAALSQDPALLRVLAEGRDL